MLPVVRIAAAIATSALVLAGCDSAGTDNKPPGTPQSVLENGLDPSRQGPAPELKGAHVGGVVTGLSSIGLFTMDPTEAYTFEAVSILSGLVTRSLTQYAYDAERGAMVLVPDLATDLGTPNDDFTAWTYTIRAGVKFEDGSPVTADDVAYGIKRSFDRKTFPLGPTYSNDFFLHGDTYHGPYRPGSNDDGVVVDGNKLTIKMARPFPDMPYYGAFPVMGPIPQAASDPTSYRLHPLATGPYKFAQYVPGKSLTLVHNDQWDPATDPGRHNYPDRFEFDFTTSSDSAGGAILADQGLGPTTVMMNKPSDQQLRIALHDRPDQLVEGPTSCVHVLAIDYRKITDLRVRKAIGTAYPFQALVAATVGTDPASTAVPGRSLLPPGVPGRTDYNPLPTPVGESDPAAAKALLAEAGWSPGTFRLSFAFQAHDPVDTAWKDVMVKAYRAAGFAVTLYATSSDNELGSVERDPNPNSPLNLRRGGGGWCSDWPSGNGSMLPLVGRDSPDPSRMLTYFSEPSVDADIQRIRQLPFAEQPAAWGALDQTIETKYYPFVVTDYRQEALLVGSRIGGMHNDPVLTMPTWKDLYVIR